MEDIFLLQHQIFIFRTVRANHKITIYNQIGVTSPRDFGISPIREFVGAATIRKGHNSHLIIYR